MSRGDLEWQITVPKDGGLGGILPVLIHWVVEEILPMGSP